MNHILLRKQEPVSSVRKSLNRYANIKAQTSDEIQPLEKYENSIVVFDDMLLSRQESNIDLFFTKQRHNNRDIYYTSRGFFRLPKITTHINSNTFIFLKQNLWDIIFLFHDIAG